MSAFLNRNRGNFKPRRSATATRFVGIIGPILLTNRRFHYILAFTLPAVLLRSIIAGRAPARWRRATTFDAQDTRLR